MVTTNETDHGNHDVHAKGLAAIMRTEHLPLTLLGKTQSGQISIQKKTLEVSQSYLLNNPG
jgi:hypothetical protein